MTVIRAIAVFAAAILTFGAANAHAQTKAGADIAACAWSHLPDTDRTEILAAYHGAGADGIAGHVDKATAALTPHEAAVKAAYAQCDATPGVPADWIEAAIVAEALQTGAAAELTSHRQIATDVLTAAWTKAPDDTRQCIMAYAGSGFALAQSDCANLKALLWYPTQVGIDPTQDANKPDAEHVFVYMYARGLEDWSQALIRHFEGGPAPAQLLN